MKERDLDLKLAEFNVRTHTIRVREAFVELAEETKAIQARANRRIESLKVAYEMAVIDLEEAQIHLQDAKDKLDTYE